MYMMIFSAEINATLKKLTFMFLYMYVVVHKSS